MPTAWGAPLLRCLGERDEVSLRGPAREYSMDPVAKGRQLRGLRAAGRVERGSEPSDAGSS